MADTVESVADVSWWCGGVSAGACAPRYSRTFCGLFHTAGDESDLARTQAICRDLFGVHDSQFGDFVLFSGVYGGYFIPCDE